MEFKPKCYRTSSWQGHVNCKVSNWWPDQTGSNNSLKWKFGNFSNNYNYALPKGKYFILCIKNALNIYLYVCESQCDYINAQEVM